MGGFPSQATPAVRPRGSAGLFRAACRAARAIALAVILAAAGALLAAMPASADPTSAPEPSPTATTRPPQLDPLPSGLVTAFPLTVGGAGTPGDTVDVSAGGGADPNARCTSPVSGSGRFSCALRALPDGPGVTVRAASEATGLVSTGRVDVLSPPIIDPPPGGAASSGAVHGSAYPGATVTVTADNGSTCAFPAGGDGSWSCVLSGPLADGRHSVTATQVAPFSTQSSAASAPVVYVVDTTPPPAPRITSPAPGTSIAAGESMILSGVGQSGAVITVYANTSAGTTVVCAGTTTSGSWSCAGTLPAGSYLVSALARDTAGNVSAGSNVVPVTFAAPGRSAPPSPHSAVPAPPSPASPAPAAPSSPPPPASSDSGGSQSWVDTPFTRASAPAVTPASIPGWVRSAVLALAALLLLLLPSRMLSSVFAPRRGVHAASVGDVALATGPGSGRSRSPRPSVFGRNRPRAELGEAVAILGTGASDPSAPHRRVWPLGAAGGVGALLLTFSITVAGAGAYLSVVVAAAIAVAAVNAVWALAARGMSIHLGLPAPRIVVRPRFLLVVALTAIGSRLIGLEHALLFGLVINAVLAERADRAQRGRTAAVQVSAVAALGVLAWLAVGVLPAPTDVPASLLVELTNVVALVAIGSSAIALLPLGRLAGRSVFQWSRPVWLGLSLVVYTVLFAVLFPVSSLIQTGAGLVVAIIGALVFAALSVSTWLWEKYVEPLR